jgi:hypothetical protein
MELLFHAFPAPRSHFSPERWIREQSLQRSSELIRVAVLHQKPSLAVLNYLWRAAV